jgi:Flp pilus assembly protein TadB
MNNDNEHNAAPEQQQSLTELLKDLAMSSVTLMRDEIELVIRRSRERLGEVRSGFVFMAVGAAIVYAALLAACAALIIALVTYLSPTVAALLVAGLLAFVGVVLGFIGYRQIKK